MADKTIPQLDAIDELEDTDVFPVDDGTVTKKATIAQIKEAIGPTVTSDFQESEDNTGTASASTSWGNVTNANVSGIVTDGNTPVFLLLQMDREYDSTLVNTIEVGATGAAEGQFRMLRSGTADKDFSYQRLRMGDSGGGTWNFPPGMICMVDVPPAGTHDYQLQFLVSSGDSLVVTQCKLVAFKLPPIS